MRNVSTFRALFIAAGLAVAAPALSMAADLSTNVNNASAIGSPFAYPMAVTRSAEAGVPGNVGRSASPEGNPLAAAVGTTHAHSQRDGFVAPVGNSASARGGFGTGPRLG